MKTNYYVWITNKSLKVGVIGFLLLTTSFENQSTEEVARDISLRKNNIFNWVSFPLPTSLCWQFFCTFSAALTLQWLSNFYIREHFELWKKAWVAEWEEKVFEGFSRRNISMLCHNWMNLNNFTVKFEILGEENFLKFVSWVKIRKNLNVFIKTQNFTIVRVQELPGCFFCVMT